MNPRDEKDHLNYSKLPRINTPSSSRQCLSSFKNPRIVRVSRTLGGKDRHSKVCTVRGLRDRRIRLSVPTAIQLYDLQHRLGLSQPSKVVQWLIEATKHEIDKLPPLPILVPSNYYQESSSHSLSEKNKWVEYSQQEEENGGGFGGFVGQLSAHNFLPTSTQFSVPNMPYNFHWDPQNFSYMTADEQSLSSHPYLCPSVPAMASFTPTFPSYIHQSMESVQQNSVFPTTLHFICPSKAVQSPENGNGKPEKDKDIV